MLYLPSPANRDMKCSNQRQSSVIFLSNNNGRANPVLNTFPVIHDIVITITCFMLYQNEELVVKHRRDANNSRDLHASSLTECLKNESIFNATQSRLLTVNLTGCCERSVIINRRFLAALPQFISCFFCITLITFTELSFMTYYNSI